MNTELRENFNEFSRILLVPPAAGSFKDLATASEVWPENVVNNREFAGQLESRTRLNRILEEVTSKLPRPDISIYQAILKGYISESQASELYKVLADLISDPDYQRVILYIPFEFLPNTNSGLLSEELQEQAIRFGDIYMEAWANLLNTQDVRANFVDGDVLEADLREEDLPRVVKAAHLIPKLVENQLMNIEQVLELVEINKDEILRGSIGDALPVLADMNLLKEADLKRMEDSADVLLNKMAASIRASGQQETKAVHEERPLKIEIESIQQRLEEGSQHIDNKVYEGKTTAKRIEWLKQEAKQQLIESVGEEIAAAIKAGNFSKESWDDFMSPEVSPLVQQALIKGIDGAVESEAAVDMPTAKELYGKYKESLLSLWATNNSGVRDQLSETFRRLHGLGISSDKELADIGIAIPSLTRSSSENLELMADEMGDIQRIVESIESNPDLLQYIYPAVLAFGSRLKGYGGKDADIDLAVMIRPEMRVEDKDKLRGSLNGVFAHEKIQGQVVEFWLENSEDGLAVRDFEHSDPQMGDSSWTHVLFGAAWEGDKATIDDLRRKLLTPYFYNKDKTIHGRQARGLYLEEMERDNLQYRLMHKGYKKFFPAFGGIHTPHADRIDGNSTFWDSGYRLTATKLFASKVFLPKIPSNIDIMI